jgi:hypothetical protein
MTLETSDPWRNLLLWGQFLVILFILGIIAYDANQQHANRRHAQPKRHAVARHRSKPGGKPEQARAMAAKNPRQNRVAPVHVPRVITLKEGGAAGALSNSLSDALAVSDAVPVVKRSGATVPSLVVQDAMESNRQFASRANFETSVSASREYPRQDINRSRRMFGPMTFPLAR